jgi:DNA polymerase-3 subunit epsilon
MQPMQVDGFAAFDTETTGLDAHARILEIAVVTFEGGVPVREWSQLLCPEDVDWNDERVQGALAVNKIDPKDLKGHPTFEQVLPDLLLELSHSIWVAHNAAFDIRMLNQELTRAKRPALEPPLVVCTKNLAAHLSPDTKGNKLYEVAARYNVPQDAAHRAAVDATTCGLILAAMLRAGRVPREDSGLREMCKTAAGRRRS